MRAAGEFIAIALPGFGLAVRGADGFRYACDALLGLPPTNTPPALALRPDGLLIGTLEGMRAITLDGCPRAVSELAQQPVYALAQAGATMFAFAGDAVWRSTDAGDHWELRAPFASGAQITGAVYAAGKLYASRGASVLVSRDEGASFTVSPTERPLTLLAVDSGLWAVVRSAMPVGLRGYELWRAADAAGPWRSVLALNYFGGLTLDATGTVWVGDEGGGLYRSNDGETFTNVAPALYPKCLQADGERLYACNADLPSQPALFQDVQTPVVKLEQVTELVRCEQAATRCAAAWGEWQRDVLQVGGGGTSAPSDAAVAPAGAVDAGAFDAGAPGARSEGDGCALAGNPSAAWTLIALALLLRRRR